MGTLHPAKYLKDGKVSLMGLFGVVQDFTNKCTMSNFEIEGVPATH